MNKKRNSPTRKSPRLPEYDYALAGGYFITIVTHNRELLFGDVADGEMRLNEVGEIVRNCWFEIPKHFPHTSLDEFIITPNHIHGIIFIHEKDDVGEGHAPPEILHSKGATHALTDSKRHISFEFDVLQIDKFKS